MTGPFTNVEFFSLGTVMGDFHLIGDETMDCSWFDEHFLNDIVKGSYKCEGNHTKPETDRKPSTPTDEAQLESWEKDGGRGREDDSESSSGGGSTGKGLSTGAKAGIGVGVAVVALAALGLGTWLFIRRRKKQAAKETPNAGSGARKAELDGKSKPSPGAAGTRPAQELADTSRAELPAR